MIQEEETIGFKIFKIHRSAWMEVVRCLSLYYLSHRCCTYTLTNTVVVLHSKYNSRDVN